MSTDLAARKRSLQFSDSVLLGDLAILHPPALSKPRRDPSFTTAYRRHARS